MKSYRESTWHRDQNDFLTLPLIRGKSNCYRPTTYVNFAPPLRYLIVLTDSTGSQSFSLGAVGNILESTLGDRIADFDRRGHRSTGRFRSWYYGGWGVDMKRNRAIAFEFDGF